MASTPRGSVAGGNRDAHATPPSRQAAPSSRPSIHTPLNRAASRDLVASVRRGASASGGRRPNNAPTPHAKAARLALHQRRHAIFTPAKNRRRSLMEQRETPRDLLRDLSRALASKSKPIVSSPRDASPNRLAHREPDQDDDDDLPIDRPRLSVALDDDDDDDDDDDLKPPRLSAIHDDNHTAQSIELPRRALSEQPRPSLPRGSFGNVRDSDFFGNEDRLLAQDGARQSDFFPGLLEELQAGPDTDNVTFDRIDGDHTRRNTASRVSEFGFQLPAGMEDQTTFVLSDPPRETDAEPWSLEQYQATLDANDELLDMSAVHDNVGKTVLDLSPANHGRADDGPREAKARARKPRKRMSRHGIEYPPLPPSLIKKTALRALQSTGLSNHRLSPDTLCALTQASEWFFEQLGDDLGAYANHAGRKTVEESDVIALMRRQRQIGSNATIFSLAQKNLPRELLQELRMPAPQTSRKRRLKRPGSTQDDVAD
ncbi:hypothetical protein CDD81_7455 [Ophiocordyceps australis]|uniref:CENP-T/Histone H4 histone fold domain-containing protein n=1 Tax=Ophiocordyceps australis TaxID=1399860 RepID=A0A2C5YFY2_9HYPO|nr:hypothetical protein CDD81_7455 [Ophiocordyceps australis]